MSDNTTGSEGRIPEGDPGLAPDQNLEMEARIRQLEKEREEFLNLAKSRQAEFENYQKRQAREHQQEKRYAQEPLARDLLQPIDNLERAVQAAAGEAQSPLAQGVAMVLQQILEVLKRHGVKPVDALYQPFDANHHQAVNQVPNADHPPMTVVQVHQGGYMLHDRVLRPASVGVSVQPPAGAE
ncbi:MAG: nucleotide exchange factor GrpE [Gemmataceae bacterium]